MALVPQASMGYKCQQPCNDKALGHTAGSWGQHDVVCSLSRLYERWVLRISEYQRIVGTISPNINHLSIWLSRLRPLPVESDRNFQSQSCPKFKWNEQPSGGFTRENPSSLFCISGSLFAIIRAFAYANSQSPNLGQQTLPFWFRDISV